MGRVGVGMVWVDMSACFSMILVPITWVDFPLAEEMCWPFRFFLFCVKRSQWQCRSSMYFYPVFKESSNCVLSATVRAWSWAVNSISHPDMSSQCLRFDAWWGLQLFHPRALSRIHQRRKGSHLQRLDCYSRKSINRCGNNLPPFSFTVWCYWQVTRYILSVAQCKKKKTWHWWNTG